LRHSDFLTTSLMRWHSIRTRLTRKEEATAFANRDTGRESVR
jgi:hypothetical protein